MNFQLSDDGSGVYVRISGDLDFGANGEFKRIIDKLASLKGRPVTIDLASVSRIDSVGLGLLYIAKEEVGVSGVKIRLKSPQAGVMKMLELTEADDDFDIQP
jgi:anti-anti-sigma factor